MHELYDVTNIKIIGPYTLWIKFNDGAEQVVDFKAVLEGELYSPLKDLAFF